MDSATLLDRALFQLTPTRTRFDLVLFSKGKNEKFASGLFDPFISHLKSARDQISKGGYSITLLPCVSGASWFTKATFERFVCFVSTPAVLERFVSLEREILQIERSIQANELNSDASNGRHEEDANGNTRKSNDFIKVNGEVKMKDGTAQKENSKIQLQRILATRKALLRKEQAMTYARGLVAGFAVEKMEDLISFADEFGASRLREACINFKELCKKKHADRLWMEELARVEACSPSELPLLEKSGIMLANGMMSNLPINGASTVEDASNVSSEASKQGSKFSGAADCKRDDNSFASYQTASATTKNQMPLQWQNQMPQPIYNLQGYPFHPMQPMPLPYAMNMTWPPNMNQKSSSGKKKKFSNRKKLEYTGEEKRTESSGSDYGSDSSSDMQEEDRKHSSPDSPYTKKNCKKSSRTVVIRNINYITPERSGEKGQVWDGSYSGEDDLIGADSLQQKVDDTVKSLKLKEISMSNSSDKRSAGKSQILNEDPNDLFTNTSVEGKRNENWETFQNLLMRDEENASVNEVGWKQTNDVQEHFMARIFDGEISAITPAMNFESEKFPMQQQTVYSDSFAMTERDAKHETRGNLNDLFYGENLRPVMKRGDYVQLDLLRPERVEESGNELSTLISISANESSVIRSRREEGWFVGNHSVKPDYQDSVKNQILFNGGHVLSVNGDPLYSQSSRKDVLIDDSLIVTARPAIDDQDDSRWKTDVSLVADLDGKIDASKDEHKVLDTQEAIDLCFVLERNPGLESSRDSWTMDYQIDLSFTEPNRRLASESADERIPSDHNTTITKQNGGTKMAAKEAKCKVLNGTLGKSRAEIMSKSKKPSAISRSIIQKSKLEKEEEMRKKMEEQLIERQRRITERTAACGYTSPVMRKASSESKVAKGSIKSDKNKNISAVQVTNRLNSVKLRAT